MPREYGCIGEYSRSCFHMSSFMNFKSKVVDFGKPGLGVFAQILR